MGTARAKGLSPAAPAVPAQRRRPGGWKTALWAHLGSSCRARARAARTGHVAQGRPALEPARPTLPGGAVGNMLDMNTHQRGCAPQRRHACTQPSAHTATASETDRLGSMPHPSCVPAASHSTSLGLSGLNCKRNIPITTSRRSILGALPDTEGALRKWEPLP